MYLREKAVRAEVAVERDQALEAEAEARARKSEAEKTIQFLQEMLSQADPGQALGQDVTVRDVLDRAARKLESGALNAQPVAEAALRTTIGVAYRALGLYDPAERHIRIALAIRRRCLGERHASVAESSLTLGMVLMEKGDYESAGPFIQDGVSLQPDAASGVPASTLNLEAAAALNRGDLNLSERLYRKDLELLTARRGVASSEVADAMSNLGVLLCRKGEFEEAEMLYTKALDIRRRTLDPRHPDIADSLHALGDLFVKRDMSSQAEPLLREALEFRKVLREHWRIPLIEASLGECLIVICFNQSETNWLAE
jgi:non-specific serine/threonine protein kinase/serine/threonine-protein kinase